MELTTNTRFKESCPPLTKDEFNRLAENILNDGGIFDPIIVWNDTIIDGHNRYKISQQYDLPFNTKDIYFDSEDDAVLWIKEHQLGTRNLTDAQVWTLVKEIEEMLKAKGKETQGERTDLLSTVDKTLEPHNTQKEISDKTGWSLGKVATAQYVDKHAEDDLKDEVYSSKKTFNKAYREIKEYKETLTEEFYIVETIEKRLMSTLDKCKMYEFMNGAVPQIKELINKTREIKETFVISNSLPE